MKTVYISGPMTGFPDFNFPAFFAAEKQWKKWGWEVINPARIELIEEGWPDPDQLPSFEGTRDRAFRDIEELFGLKAEEGDAIACLPGAEGSFGARAEIAIAEWLGLNILDAESGRVLVYGRALDSTIRRPEGGKVGTLRSTPVGLDGPSSKGIRVRSEQVQPEQLEEGLPVGVEHRSSPETYSIMVPRGGSGQGKQAPPSSSCDLPPSLVDALLKNAGFI